MVGYIKCATLAFLIQKCWAQAEFPFFFSYEPKTSVSDHAAIDMDQREIEREVKRSSSLGFKAARRVYMEGGHSRSYASLSLDDPVSKRFAWGTPVTGHTEAGAKVTGTIEKDMATGNDVLWFLYDVSDELGKHVGCQVGGTSEPLIRGCLADRGTIIVGSEKLEMNYTYDSMSANRNGRRFDKFSTEARDKMNPCNDDDCSYEEFYADYTKFVNYYGQFEYADTWIRSAFEALETEFTNGNADFSQISSAGRAEAVSTATAFMSLWMYIIREMESSVNSCVDNCGQNGDPCPDSNVHAWDQAVAFYVGSLERGSGGYLQYSLANRMCLLFDTCGYEGVENTGTASVNLHILKEFEAGQENVILGRCETLKKNKERIVQLMTVPLLQATLSQAHLTYDLSDATDKEIGKGAAFAATVLPLVHACSTSDAEIIYDNMRIGRKESGAFEDVKNAFERNYNCMGVTCDDIGGIINKRTGSYYNNAQPCNSADLISSGSSSQLQSQQGSGGSKAGIVIGIPVAICAVIGILALLYYGKFKSGVEFTGKASDLEPSQENTNENIRYSDNENVPYVDEQDTMGISSVTVT